MSPLRFKYPEWLHLFTVALMLTSIFPVFGQSYVLTQYNSRNGIGHDNVRKIVADSSGFIWMATWDGLTRYDGTDFINYFHDPADSTTIPYFSVTSVVIDALDQLWVLTDNGALSLFDRAREEFSQVRSLGSHSMNDLVSFTAGSDGYLYFLLRKELLRYNPATGETYPYMWSADIRGIARFDYNQFSIVYDGLDHLWLTGPIAVEVGLREDLEHKQGLAEILSVNTIERLPGRPGFFFDSAGSARFTRDTYGNIWMAATTGLFRYNAERKVFSEYGGEISDLSFADSLPVVFYRHGTGLNIWFPGKEDIVTLSQRESGLPTEIFFYGSEMLWLSCQSEGGTPAGVVKAVFTPYDFRHINPFPPGNNDLNVFGIITDREDGLWLAARDRNYLIRISRDGKTERINTLGEQELKKLWHPRSFLPDSNGIWIGYYWEQLIHYDPSTGHIERHNPASLVHTMCYDRDGKILIADQGIVRYDPETRKSERLYTAGDTMIIFTFHLEDSILWAGTGNSYLIKFDLVTLKPEFIKLSRGRANIEDICVSEDGSLWLATLGTGVCRYDPVTGDKLFYTTASGLTNNTTYSVMPDRRGNIWVSTNSGISVINPVSGLIRSFGENDGLMIYEFNSDASWITDDGKFLLGGVGGAVEFDPEQVLGEQPGGIKSRIIIKAFEVSAIKRILDRPVYKADTIMLRKGDDNFHISFVVPEYRHPEKIRYRYRLDSGSDNWYYTDHSDRNINFSNLDPGWHNLEIQATDAGGSWGLSKKLAIHINPYFYQTLLFRVAMPLFLMLLLGTIIWVALKQMRDRERQKRDTLRHQALRGQMNPHFIFNSLNSINYFISKNDTLSANRYIADFSKLIRTVLNNMNEEYVRLSIELGSLEDYLKIEYLRFGNKFDYSLEVDPQVVPGSIRVSPGIVQPFVENAIWHGVMGLDRRKGMIRVSLKMHDNHLVCTVEDDGVGRARSEAMKDNSLPKKSKGISLAMERLRIINNLQATNYRIVISDLHPDRVETGTRVEIDMPVMVRA
ncbi:MAG: histidine kinase [Bacteroidales bacterium]